MGKKKPRAPRAPRVRHVALITGRPKKRRARKARKASAKRDIIREIRRFHLRYPRTSYGGAYCLTTDPVDDDE